MADQKLQIVIDAKNNTEKEFKEITRNFSNLKKNAGESMDAMGKISASVVKGFAVAGTAIAAFGGLALKAAADAEQIRVSFGTMLGSMEKADTLMRDLMAFAKKTPFELTGLQESTKRLLAYGVSQEDVLGDLKMLGDISSTVGLEKLPFLITAFGQVKAKTELSGEELRQFMETGVSLVPELAKVTGYSIQQIVGDTKDLGITFEQVQEALTNMTKEGGIAFNAMDAQSQTLSGMVSNLKDAWNQFLLGEGQRLIDWAKDITGKLIYFVDSVLPPLISNIATLISKIKENKFVLDLLIGAFALLTAGIVASRAAIMVKGILEAMQLFAIATGAATTEVGLLRAALAAVPLALTITVALIGFALVMSRIRELKREIGEASDSASKEAEMNQTAINKARELRESGETEKAKRLEDVVKRNINLPNLQLATGGVVTKPTTALIGEAGPEAVIPLNKMSKTMGGTSVVVNVYGDVSGQELVEKVGDALTQRLQLSTAIS